MVLERKILILDNFTLFLHFYVKFSFEENLPLYLKKSVKSLYPRMVSTKID
jgi:hypothetical protein